MHMSGVVMHICVRCSPAAMPGVAIDVACSHLALKLIKIVSIQLVASVFHYI